MSQPNPALAAAAVVCAAELDEGRLTYARINYAKAFEAGARWAFECEAVADLVSALERCDYFDERSLDIATGALARWNEMRGGK